jgi:hypothetical protein
MRPPTAAASTRFILLIGVKSVVYGPAKSAKDDRTVASN